MALTLKKTPGWPAGGYPFRDPRTSKVFDGMSADLNLQAQNVVKHRRANPRFYPSNDTHWFQVSIVRQEIVDYMCGQKPELCTDGVASPAHSNLAVQQPSSKCPSCGSGEATAILCKTCSGQKIVGWKCKACSKERAK